MERFHVNANRWFVFGFPFFNSISGLAWKFLLKNEYRHVILPKENLFGLFQEAQDF